MGNKSSNDSGPGCAGTTETGNNNPIDDSKYIDVVIGGRFDHPGYCEWATQGNANCATAEFISDGNGEGRCKCRAMCNDGCHRKACKRIAFNGDPTSCCASLKPWLGKGQTCNPKFRSYNTTDCNQYMREYCKKDNNYNNNPNCKVWVSKYPEEKRDVLFSTCSNIDNEECTNYMNEYCSIGQNFANDQNCINWYNSHKNEKNKLYLEKCSKDEFMKNDYCKNYIREYCSTNMFTSNDCKKWYDKKLLNDVVNELCNKPEHINKNECGCFKAMRDNGTNDINKLQCLDNRCAVNSQTFKTFVPNASCDVCFYTVNEIDEIFKVENPNFNTTFANNCKKKSFDFKTEEELKRKAEEKKAIEEAKRKEEELKKIAEQKALEEAKQKAIEEAKRIAEQTSEEARKKDEQKRIAEQKTAEQKAIDAKLEAEKAAEEARLALANARTEEETKNAKQKEENAKIAAQKADAANLEAIKLKEVNNQIATINNQNKEQVNIFKNPWVIGGISGGVLLIIIIIIVIIIMTSRKK
jgi:hypothetical protein